MRMCVSICLILFHILVHWVLQDILLVQKKGSEQSEAGDDTKKMRIDSLTTSFSENDHVFLEGLKSDDCCSILANCFKNILKIEELFAMVKKNNETQIKG